MSIDMYSSLYAGILDIWINSSLKFLRSEVMLLRNLLLAFFLLTASSAILADTIDFNMRDNSVQLQYIAPMGRDTLGSSEIHAGFLYTNDQNRYGDIGLLVQ